MKLPLTYPCIAKYQAVVELKDFRPKTKKEYVRYLCKLAEHFQCDPATLTQDQVREYFLFLRQHKHYGGSAMTVARASLRCFFQDCLTHADWTVFHELAIRRVEPLPVVLSREDVDAKADALIQYIYQRVIDQTSQVGEEQITVRDFADLHRWFDSVLRHMEGQNREAWQTHHYSFHLVSLNKLRNFGQSHSIALPENYL